MLIVFCLLVSALLQFGAVIGGTVLYKVLRTLLRKENKGLKVDDTYVISALLIAIAICLIGAVYVMPA
jgi:hypothetical protein